MGWARPPAVTSPAGRSAVQRQAGVRTGWADARTSPYRPYARGRKEKRTAVGRQREGDQRKRMREKSRRGGVRQRVGLAKPAQR